MYIGGNTGAIIGYPSFLPAYHVKRGRREPLLQQFRKCISDPLKSRRTGGIIKRKNYKCATGIGGCFRGSSPHPCHKKSWYEKKSDSSQDIAIIAISAAQFQLAMEK